MKFQLNTYSIVFYWMISILVLISYFYSFYPGYMSSDSALQYKQVISGDWNTISPIIMVILWNITNEIVDGPGGLFVLFYFLFWLGLVLFTYNLKLNFWVKSLIFAVIALWPYNLMILPHLWKDVGLISFIVLSIGCVQLHLKTNKKHPLFIALLTLLIAALFRFESIVYIGVLQFYVILLIFRAYQQQRKIILKTVGSGFLVIIASVLISQAIVNITNSKKIILWQTIALWDLSRVSVKVDKVLLPDFCIGPDLSTQDLSNATVSWTNTQLFWKTKAGMNSGLDMPYKDSQYKVLFNKWLSMLAEYPLEYLTHRIEVINDLLRFDESSNKPIDLYFSRKISTYNNLFKLNNSQLNMEITKGIKSNLDNIVFKGWIYLLFLFVIFIYFVSKRKTNQSEFILILSLSGIFSIIILTFVAPSAEQRYLVWLINSSLLIMPLLLQKRHIN